MNAERAITSAGAAMVSLALAAGIAGCDRHSAPDVEAAAQTETPSTPSATQAPVVSEGVAAQVVMMDKNGDGSIGADEHAAGAGNMFATMDADHDGTVTTTEMDAAQAAFKGDKRMSSADKIKTIDGNADGTLSREEHEAGSQAMFAKMDADGDGRLTPAEMQAGHDKTMGK